MAKRPHAQHTRHSLSGVQHSARAVVDRLNQQAWAIHSADPRQAITLAAEARAAGHNYLPGAARSHYILGVCHAQLDEYAEARTELLAALERYETLGEREPQANALNMLGNVHSALGDHHAAYALYLRSLALRQTLGLTHDEAASWNNLGNAYYHLGDYPQALEAHQRSLALKEALGDQRGAAISLNNIGNVYKAGADLTSALHYYQQSLTLAQAVGNKYSQAGVLGNLGVVYSQLANPQAALAYHLQSLAIEREIGHRHGEAESLFHLGQLFFQNPTLQPVAEAGAPDADPASHYLQQASALANELHAREIMMHIAELLAQLYAQRGAFAQAFAAYGEFHTLERALFNEALSEKTKQLQIIHQVETAVRAAELKRVEAELAHLKNTELQALFQAADRQRSIAEEASCFKTKLLSVAAHDLKNPLTGISGFADLLLLQIPADSPLQEIAERIRQSAQRMGHMLDDLLDSTRIESGRFRVEREQFDLALLVQQIVEPYQQHAQKKAQTLSLAAEATCLVCADRFCMWRVLENLLSNAIKFSPYGCRIWVTLTCHGHHIRCAVRDEGPGLTADDQRKLFGRFERLSATPTGGESSTGLGLAIVRQLVELQGGRVWAESAGPGHGSTFIVEFPSAGLLAQQA